MMVIKAGVDLITWSVSTCRPCRRRAVRRFSVGGPPPPAFRRFPRGPARRCACVRPRRRPDPTLRCWCRRRRLPPPPSDLRLAETRRPHLLSCSLVCKEAWRASAHLTLRRLRRRPSTKPLPLLTREQSEHRMCTLTRPSRGCCATTRYCRRRRRS